jgi:cyclohexadienyl dehydratase
MFRSLIGFVLACVLPASLALAQVPSASRLDDVIKSGKLRVCTPGAYKPFSYQRPDGGYEGLDIDLVQSAAKALGVEVEMGKTAWPSLRRTLDKCDSRSADLRQHRPAEDGVLHDRLHGQRRPR